MNRFSFRNKKSLALLALGLMLVLGVGSWFGRTPILTWYYVHALAGADEASQAACVERVVGLDEAAVPALVRRLTENNGRVCANVHAALTALQEHWGWDDPRSAALAVQLADAIGHMSVPGQEVVLRLKLAWWKPATGARTPPAAVLEADTQLVTEAVRLPGKEVRTLGLQLAGALLLQPGPSASLEKWREVARIGLRDAEPEVRVRAIQLAQTPSLALLDYVAPLLRDQAAEVRRAAILAVGPAQAAISSEDLLPWLHDTDADVRRLCEVALRGRDVSEDNLHLGRLITDPRHDARLEAINELLADPRREPSEWLRRLSHDPTPSVRAAAIRAAALRPRVDLSDRLREMTKSDPSPTICQLAQYYLTSRNQQLLLRDD